MLLSFKVGWCINLLKYKWTGFNAAFSWRSFVQFLEKAFGLRLVFLDISVTLKYEEEEKYELLLWRQERLVASLRHVLFKY